MVKHEHAGGEYNARRAEVEEGTRILHRRWPSIVALRDATEAQLVECRQQMPENVFRRCRHIITENKRVELAASALERGDLPAFGLLMAEGTAAFAMISRPAAANSIRWSKSPPVFPVVTEPA